MNISERIKERRKALGLTLQDIGDEIGVAKATVQRYESGDIQNVGLDKIANLADVLKVTPGWLVGWESSDQDNKSMVARVTAPSPKMVPILGTIRAGRPIPALEDYEGELDLSYECQADFALRVTGDSMSWAGLHHGDIALLVHGAEPRHGDIVAAGKADGDWSATLKYYISNNGAPCLRAANPEYPDIPLTDGWSIVGIVVHVIKKAPGIVRYQELMSAKEHRDNAWAGVIETATEYGLDADSVKGFISGMHMMIKAARK